MSMVKSKWEECYRNYKSLEYSWEWNNAPSVLKEQALRQVLTSPKEPSLVKKEMQKWGYGMPDEEQWVKQWVKHRKHSVVQSF